MSSHVFSPINYRLSVVKLLTFCTLSAFFIVVCQHITVTVQSHVYLTILHTGTYKVVISGSCNSVIATLNVIKK